MIRKLNWLHWKLQQIGNKNKTRQIAFSFLFVFDTQSKNNGSHVFALGLIFSFNLSILTFFVIKRR